MRNGLRPALAFVVLSGACAAYADESNRPPSEVTLHTVLQMVSERAPRLAAERASIDAARAERITAGVLPNPSISFGRFKPGGGARTVFDGSSQQQVTVDFPVLIASQRRARIGAADQAIAAAQAHVGLAKSDLMVRAAELYIGLQAAQEQVATLEEAIAEERRLSAIVSGRLDSGVATRYELTRVEVETTAVVLKLEAARTERTARATELAGLLGMPTWRPIAVGRPEPVGIATDASEWVDSLNQTNPEVVAARRDETTAAAALQRATAERWPVPVLSVGRTWTSDPFGAANFVGVSTEVPLFDNKRGPVAKAEADLQEAQWRRQAAEAEAMAALLQALETLARHNAALRQYDAAVSARLGSLKQMAEDFYQLGRGSILELIDAARSRVESQLAGVELRALAAEQEMHVLALTGRIGQ